MKKILVILFILGILSTNSFAELVKLNDDEYLDSSFILRMECVNNRSVPESYHVYIVTIAFTEFRSNDFATKKEATDFMSEIREKQKGGLSMKDIQAKELKDLNSKLDEVLKLIKSKKESK